MESAIHTISEAYQGISRMLAIHEEKIENGNNSDSIILQTIKEMDKKNSFEHKNVMAKIEQMELKFEEKDKLIKEEFQEQIKDQDKKIESLVKFRLLVGGAILIIGFLFTQQQIKIFEFLPSQNPSGIVKPDK